jgi:hypothetical protein
VNHPSPRFIVSHYLFREHETFADAEAERLRLCGVFPHKAFKVYCIAGDFDNAELKDAKRRAKRKHFNKTEKKLPKE